MGKLPQSAGAIGARFSEDGATMYVSSATGLQIYDVSQPEAPKQLSELPLPHFENEDVDVGRDTVVITNDPSFSGVGMIYLIDVSDPAAPALRSALPTSDTTQNGHIANCIAGCDYLYTTGTAEGLSVYDIRDLAAPKFVKTIPLPGEGFTHDVHVDALGRGVGDGGGRDVRLRRVRSAEPGAAVPVGPVDHQHRRRAPRLRRLRPARLPAPQHAPHLDQHERRGRAERGAGGQGNVVAITEEDYLKPTCEGQGSVQTWRITDERNPDGSIKLELLDMWTTELNELVNFTGRSPVTGNCSAHWFDEQGGMLAQGWYDQGVRFLDISNPRDIKQVAYYATTGTFWAAYFAPLDPTHGTVYALDLTSGIDVLYVDRTSRAVKAPASLTTASSA